MRQLLTGKLSMLLQEDKVPAHASKYQDEVFRLYDILRLLLSGNSPDMNMIEPCWPWMKRITTKKGALRTCKNAEKRWQKVWDELPQEKIQAWIERMSRHLQIIRFLKGDNKYKKGRIDGRTDTKEGKKRLGELIAEMEKARAFEKNEQLSYISDFSTSPTDNLDNLLSSSDSDSPDTSLRMPIPIRYSRLSHPPENLSRSITPDLPPPGTFEYYLASVPTTPQRMTPELQNMADSIPYTPPLPPPECGIDNNEGMFLSDDDRPSPAGQDKGKEPI